MGFWFQHDEPNSLFVVPAGYVVCVAGGFEHKGIGSQGLRWGFMEQNSKPSIELAIKMVKEIKQAYPQLDTEGSDYNTWLQCLQHTLLPTVLAARAASAAATPTVTS